MTQKEFISRPLFCTDGGVALSGRYRDHGCVVVPAGGIRYTADAEKSSAAEKIMKITAKLDKLIELMAKRIQAENVAKKTADHALSADEMAAARFTRACTEARAGYVARNPHRNAPDFREWERGV